MVLLLLAAETLLIEADFTKGAPKDARIAVSGGRWSGGWEVMGDTDRILVDAGREIQNGFLEVTVTRTGDLDFPQGRHKRNWLGFFATPAGHQSPGGYARAGGRAYGFSKAEIFSSRQTNTICEKKFGGAEDWKLDGRTEHTVRAEVANGVMRWTVGNSGAAECGGTGEPVSHVRYAMLGGVLDHLDGWHHGSLVGLKVLRFRVVERK
jgi:hypothetical protein